MNREEYTQKEELLCEILRKEGEGHFQNGKYTKALHSFSDALRHIPEDKSSLVWRSKCYLKLRQISKATDDVDAALHLDSVYKEGLLQKAELLGLSGHYEMALVYLNRGAKTFPKAQEFKDGIKKAKKSSQRTGRRMKMSATGDLTYFTHKSPPAKSFTWKKKPKDRPSNSSLPSATFRMRQNVHPLSRIHRTPTVMLNESRASTINTFMSSSLESLVVEDKLVKETNEKELLGRLYEDKEYLKFLVANEAKKTKSNLHKDADIADSAVDGLYFLQERTQFWDSLGPLPPPHPSKRSVTKLGNSRLSLYTSTESLTSIGTEKSHSTFRSYKSSQTNASKKGKRPYVSRYATRSRREKTQPPNPTRVKFEFATYQRDDELREMTEIPEEPPERVHESAEEAKRRHEEAVKRGQEVVSFIQKEVTEIDALYAKGQLDVCKRKAENCVDMLGRFTDEEVPTKPILLSTLYSCLGNCAMKIQDYVKALEYHDNDLSIGEEHNMPAVESRALGNLGRVYALMGKYNRALDLYNRKAPLCAKPQEIAWLFHEIGNCFLAMKIFEYAHESGLKALKAANEAGSKRLQLQTNILVGVAEVNLRKFKESYQHFEQGLEFAKLLNDKKAQDAMTQALVDVNKKMVTQLKKQKKDLMRPSSPKLYNVTRLTPLSRGNLLSRDTLLSAGTNVTAEG